MSPISLATSQSESTHGPFSPSPRRSPLGSFTENVKFTKTLDGCELEHQLGQVIVVQKKEHVGGRFCECQKISLFGAAGLFGRAGGLRRHYDRIKELLNTNEL